MLNQVKIEPSKSIREQLYDFLKNNKDTWYNTDELGKIFQISPDDVSKYLNKLFVNGFLVNNKWEYVERIRMGKKRNMRIRLWKADLD